MNNIFIAIVAFLSTSILSFSQEALIEEGSSNLMIFMSENDCEIYVNYLNPFIKSIESFNIQCFIVVSSNTLPDKDYYDKLLSKYEFVDVIYDKYNIVAKSYGINDSPRYILLDTNGKRLADDYVGKKNIEFEHLVSAGKRDVNLRVEPQASIMVHTEKKPIQTNHLPRVVQYCDTQNQYYIRNGKKQPFFVVDSSGMVIKRIANDNIFTDSRGWNYAFGWANECSTLFMSGLKYDETISITKYDLKTDKFYDSIDINAIDYELIFDHYNPVFYNRFKDSYYQTIQLDRISGSLKLADTTPMFIEYDNDGKKIKSFGTFSDRYTKYKVSYWNEPTLMFSEKYIVSKQYLDREIEYYDHQGKHIKSVSLESPEYYRIFNHDYKATKEPKYTKWMNENLTRSKSFISNEDASIFAEVLQNTFFDEMGREKEQNYLVVYDSEGKLLNKKGYKFDNGFFVHAIEGGRLLTSRYNDDFILHIEWYDIEDFRR